MAEEEVKLVWTKPALNHLREAHDYIEIDSPGAAARLIDRIEIAINRLRMFPQMGRPSARPDTRELVIPQTPFIAVYLVRQETVFILAILHGARNWK